MSRLVPVLETTPVGADEAVAAYVAALLALVAAPAPAPSPAEADDTSAHAA